MRKAASKQPAAPPHPTARSQAKEGPYAVPQPIRTLYRLQNGGERERWLVQTVQVDSRRPAGGGGLAALRRVVVFCCWVQARGWNEV